MKNLFDLQLFAEEETTEVSTDPQQQDEIPEELAGYDEDVRREIMAQIKPEDEAPKEDEAHTEDPPAETDSDNKTVEDVLDEPTKAIPYKRFKEVNDKAKSAAQEAAQLKEQLATLQARIQQPVQPPVQQVQQPAQQQIPQGPRISPELAAKINEIAYSEALQMSGLTKEEVTALEYAEDNDPKIQTWKGALDFARTRAWTSVDTEFRNRQLQAHTQLQLHQQIVNDFESFTQEQEKEADFQQIREYAVNDLYSKLAPLEQQTIAEAYRRVENKDRFAARRLCNQAIFQSCGRRLPQ